MNITSDNNNNGFCLRSKVVGAIGLAMILLQSIAYSQQLEVKMRSGEKVQGKFLSETVISLSLNVFSKSRDAFTLITLEKAEIFSVYDLTEDKDVTLLYLGVKTPTQDNTPVVRETIQPQRDTPYPTTSNIANLQDVVLLRNGSVVRGIVIEQIPNISLKIQTMDGSVVNYSIDEVQMITKEPAIRGQQRIRSDKSPVLAFFMSFFITGAGQFYNGDVVKGVVLLGGAFGGWAIYFANADRRSTRQTASIGALVALVCSIWSMIDAPIAASAINDEMRQQGYLYMQKAESWSVAFPKQVPNSDFNMTLRIAIPF